MAGGDDRLASDRLHKQLANWSEGFRYEVDFWREWFATKGLSWPDDYAMRFDTALPLEPGLAELVAGSSRPDVRILDVGSGPASNVGKTMQGGEVHLRACDPLAHQYAELWEEFGAYPPVRTEFAVVEELSSFFEPSTFDIAHCRNALDHSFDPLRGIVEMLKIVRVGGWVVLRHHPNEAERESYAGFHQYNFEIRNGKFVIWSREETLEPANLMPVATEFACRDDGDVVVMIRKKGEFPRGLTSAEPQQRLRQIYGAMIKLFASAPPPAAS
jgi:SAM-dependent methyltransferase